MALPVIDRYQVIRGLGRGAMGSVYLAHDPKIGRDVAIKVLQKEYAHNEKHRMRFDREARAIAALRHPNIVEIYDYGGSPDRYLYLVMEYVRGPHTGKLVREHGPFPELVVTAAGMELCSALARAHDAGIIHRDLKPENVFLDRGRLVLADFGIAKAITEANPLGAAAANPLTDVIGTPGFMAPEQLEQEPLDQRTDLFALGALLYYWGSKKLPYDADSRYGLLRVFRETRPTPLVELRPELSEALSRLVQDCLEIDRDLRPARAQVIYQRLRQVLESSGGTEPREILAAYEADPEGFRDSNRRRVVKHLIDGLKIAVRDQDAIAADEIRIRLGVLDPGNKEAQRITGVRPLLRQTRQDTDPEIVIRRAARRRPLVLLAIVIAAAAGIAVWAWQGTRFLSGPPAAGSRIASSVLMIRSDEPTQVFLNGHALGHTPDFTPANVPSGRVHLELLQSHYGRLQHHINLPPGKTVRLFVDWQHHRIRADVRARW